jgi:transposase-like protein
LQEEDMKRQNSMGVPASPNGKFTVDKRLRALKVIAECGGSLTLASMRLGVSIPTLSRWRSASRAGGA